MGEKTKVAPCIFRIRQNLFLLDVQVAQIGRKREKFHGSLQLAKDRVAEIRKEMLEEKMHGSVIGCSLKTVGDVLRYYDKYHYSKTTRSRTSRAQFDRIMGTFDNVSLFGRERLHAAMFQDFLDRLGDVRPATINSHIITLSAAFRFAIDRGLATENPVRAVKKLPEENIQRRIVSEQEYEAIKNELPEYRRKWLEFIFKIPTRRTEVLGLRWDRDYDHNERCFRLDDNRSKTGVGRLLPIPRSMFEWVDLNKESGCPWVFPVYGEMADGRNALQCLQRACKRLGLTDINIHTFRRTAAVRMLRANVPLRSIQLVGGWKDLRTLSSRYLALSGTDLRNAVDAVDRQNSDTSFTYSEYDSAISLAS